MLCSSWSAYVHRIASCWPHDFMGLAFVYICLLAPQVALSQLLTNLPQNHRPTGRNLVYMCCSITKVWLYSLSLRTKISDLLVNQYNFDLSAGRYILAPVRCVLRKWLIKAVDPQSTTWRGFRETRCVHYTKMWKCEILQLSPCPIGIEREGSEASRGVGGKVTAKWVVQPAAE